MKMKKDLNNNSYYISKSIKEMLDKGKYQVHHKDWDRVYIIDGEEGSGKSLLGLQLGYHLDPTLSLNQIVFTGKEFSEAISKAEKNQCIIFDEAFNGLDSTGASTKLNRLIVRKLMECRQKNLFLIIILPTIFLLQKYAAIFRSKCLFHVYTTSKGDRGYYRVYNKLNKKLLFLLGKKMYSYAQPYIRKSYRFYSKYPINEDSYRQKKLKSLEYEEEEGKITKDVLMSGAYAALLNIKYKITYLQQQEFMESVGVRIHLSNIAIRVRRIQEVCDLKEVCNKVNYEKEKLLKDNVPSNSNVPLSDTQESELPLIKPLFPSKPQEVAISD